MTVRGGSALVTGAAAVVVRDVQGPEEMHACEQLYADVMGLRAGDGSINPRLLIALQHNGGYVIGAFLAGKAVGFAYSFLGCDRLGAGINDLYQYSQLAVVAQGMQGEGIGKRLKLAQRDRCLADGLHRIKWAYDPLQTRNGHFNLNVLGAHVVGFTPAMYGGSGFGTYTGDATDRFIVDWSLDADSPTTGRPVPTCTWRVGSYVEDRDDLLIAVPARWDRFRAEAGTETAATVRDQLRDAFTQVLDTGRVGVSCQAVDQDAAVYRFTHLAQQADLP